MQGCQKRYSAGDGRRRQSGNVMSQPEDAIAASDAFHVPLTPLNTCWRGRGSGHRWAYYRLSVSETAE